MCPLEETSCDSIHQALRIIGDKWSGLIIYQLSTGPKRFSELEQVLHIGPRTLSQRLENLACEQVLTKQTYAEKPPRVEYTLTERGHDLLPILECMAVWGRKYGESASLPGTPPGSAADAGKPLDASDIRG
jgi:DNA-binding HxlR family transcriptional regulator